MLFLKSVLNWVWPVGMMALGVYLLSSSVLTLIYGGMLGVGAFVLGVRMWARVNDDFRQRTETMLKEMLQPKEPTEVNTTVPPQTGYQD